MTQRTGRPPADPAKLAAALARIETGESVTEAARSVGIGKDPVYRAIAAKRAEEHAAASAPSSRPTAASVPPAAPTRVAGGTEADDLEILDAEIDASRAQLRAARAEGKTHGVAAMQKNLLDLIRRRRELRPPAPPNADDEERRWRADADAVLKEIESGVLEAERNAAERAA